MILNTLSKKQILALPPLTREAEKEAIRLWQEEGALSARDLIILSYFKWIHKIAFYQSRRYRTDVEPLISDGVMGLFRALQSFKPEHGVRFSTYAFFWARSYMIETLSSLGFVVKNPRVSREIKEEATRGKKNFTIPQRDLSLDAAFSSEDDSRRIIETLADERETPEEYVLRRDDEVKKRAFFKKALKTLSPREQCVLQIRYGGESVPSLDVTGKFLNLSNEGVRQIEKRALKKLRHPKRFLKF